MKFTKAQVDQGRALVTGNAEARLQLGDLILKIAPVGADGVNTGTTAVVAEYATEIGISAAQAEVYRRISAKIPKTLRKLVTKNKVTVAYGIWRYAAEAEDRIEKLTELVNEHANGRILLDDFTALFGKAPSHRQSKSVKKQLEDPVAREELIKEVAKNPDVVKKINEKHQEEKFGKPKSTKVPNLEKHVDDKVSNIGNMLESLTSVDHTQFSEKFRKAMNLEFRQIAYTATQLAALYAPADLDAELHELTKEN